MSKAFAVFVHSGRVLRRARREVQERRSLIAKTRECIWLNAVEGFFSKLTRQSLKLGVFRSVAKLEQAIARTIAANNRTSKPFVWTATAKAIRTKLGLNRPSASMH